MEAEQTAHYMTQRLMCQVDLVYLMEEIYGMTTANKEGRRLWHAPIHHKVCRELEGNWSSLIHTSRNMLKSTIAKGWVVQQILADPVNVAIGMWSRSSARVRVELASIKGMLRNAKLLELFPDRIPAKERKWEVSRQDALTVTRKVPDDEGHLREIPIDEAQVEVWGLDSTVVGRHYTHHFYDDIIERSNTQTANMIEKTQDQWEAIQAMRSPETIEKMVGTPWHQLDLYAIAEEEGFFDSKLTLPGILGNGKIVYPFFTKEFLDRQRRRMSEYLFSCQYLLDTRPKSHRMFTLPVPYWKELPSDPVYYIAVDPSTGKNERTDKTGIAVGCVSRAAPTAVFYTEADSYRLKPEEIADELVKRILRYQPARVGIEFGLQAALYPLIKLKLDEAMKNNRIRRPEFLDIKTGGGAGALNKADKIDRTLGAMVRDNRAFFRPEMRRLFAQMAAFNPNVQKNDDDILDAGGMLIQTIPNFHQAYWEDEKGQPMVHGFTIEWFKRGNRKGDKRDRIFAA